MKNLNDIKLACGTLLVDADLSKLLSVRGYQVGRVDAVSIVLGNTKNMRNWQDPEGVRFSVAGSACVGPEDVYADHRMAYAKAAHAAEQLTKSLRAKERGDAEEPETL